jgi:hypothetical protein
VEYEMTPTKMLRFVMRDGKMILQQWWSELDEYGCNGETMYCVYRHYTVGEWRDVPVEEEMK